ncbi:MAG: hypothetical protein GC179_05435 [Anaerolineaceae bacterium]|nr:hypothetical protein [Anaerolineaceae bacterium]
MLSGVFSALDSAFSSDDQIGLVADFEVKVNGIALNAVVRRDLLTLDIYEDVDVPGMCTLTLLNWDMDTHKPTWSDSESFAIGNSIEIQMGYVDHLKTVFEGEITGLEPQFSRAEAPLVIIRGHDRRHQLLRGCKTRSFAKKKDSEIVVQVASDYGMAVQATDTSVRLDYVLQHNQTDFEFLQERARRIGYELMIDGKKLIFAPQPLRQAPAAVLSRERELMEFFPRLTSLTQVDKVEVHSWDVKEKREIVGTAAAATHNMGAKPGDSATASAFKSASSSYVDYSPSSTEEAAKLAEGRFNTMALAYVTGDGLSMGRTSIRAGTIVTVVGLGTRFSGNYYIVSTHHQYSANQGYQTGFTFRRNAT